MRIFSIGSTVPTRAPVKSWPLAPWQSAQYSGRAACRVAASSASIGNGYGRRFVSEQPSAMTARSPVDRGWAARRYRRRRFGCAPRRCRCCRPSAAASWPPPRACSHKDGKSTMPTNSRGGSFDRPVQQRLCRPERIETARTGRRLMAQEAEPVARQDQRFAHRRHGHVLQQQPVAQRIISPVARPPARPARG